MLNTAQDTEHDIGYIDPEFVDTLDDKKKRRLRRLLHNKHMKLCRKSFIDYVQYVDPSYRVAPFHEVILGATQAVAEKKKRRIILNMPPRHGKSRIISELFPAWLMGRDPKTEIIACSYGGELASSFGRKARDIVASPYHRDVFPEAKLSRDSQAAHKWNTPEGGAYYAAGVGGPITGRGADIILLDDLIKGPEEAESEQHRNKIWQWYREVLQTRLLPGGRIVALMTRWHEDDIVGRLLNPPKDVGAPRKGIRVPWEHIYFPALRKDENGNDQALWPSDYPVETLYEIMFDIGMRGWQAQYMNDPQPDEGNFFRRSWFQFHEPMPKPVPEPEPGETIDPKYLPDNLRVFGASDYAVTADAGDYTVHSVIGVSEEDNIYLLDVWRGQTDSLAWIDELLRLMRKWNPAVWIEEGGGIQKAVAGIIVKRMQEENIYVKRAAFPSTRDKATRARSFQARMEMGRIWFPKAEWCEPLMNEMLAFPLGKHDDFVDTMSMFGQHLPGLVAATPEPKKKEPMDWQNPPQPTYDDIYEQQKQQNAIRRRKRWRVGN